MSQIKEIIFGVEEYGLLNQHKACTVRELRLFLDQQDPSSRIFTTWEGVHAPLQLSLVEIKIQSE